MSRLLVLGLGLGIALSGWLVSPAPPALAPAGAFPPVDAPVSREAPWPAYDLPAPSPEAVPDANAPTPVEPEAQATASPEVTCDLSLPPPLPGRGDPLASQFWPQFREPLAPASLWNPSGPKRVGLQAGHWLVEQAPPELGRLQHGTSGGGKQEWEVNLDLAQRTARLLDADGVQVDVLSTTVPVAYRAHAFVAIHADGDPQGVARGFKVARPGFSSVPEADNLLVEALNTAYASATGLPRDDVHITRRMLYYYAFNSRRYCHAVASGVPQAIIETGFLTSAPDRQLLLGNPAAAAQGIADGILAFLTREDGQPAGQTAAAPGTAESEELPARPTTDAPRHAPSDS